MNPGGRAASRRTVLLGGVGVACAGTLAACGRSGRADGPTPSSSAPTQLYPGDLYVVALAAALENLVVEAYAQVLTRARDGALGTVPAAVTALATTVREHHVDHAGAWNAMLTAAGRPTVSGTPLSNAATLLGPVAAATSLTGILTAVTALETAAASTHLETVGAVSDAGAVRIAASIAPVEAQHAAVLTLLLGSYPVPSSYLTDAAAIRTTALTT